MTLENLRSGPYRKFRSEIEIGVDEDMERIDKDPEEFNSQLRYMFGTNFPHEVMEGVGLTPEEETDIKNFLSFVSKRLEAGAISSRAYHDTVLLDGDIKDAMVNWAPFGFRGHDAIHAMFAYLRSEGRSFVPAYMQVENVGDEDTDPAAHLEEAYVTFFTSLSKPIFIPSSHDLANGRDHVMIAVEEWERGNSFMAKIDTAYFREHRLPEFVTIMKNLYENSICENPDPKFAVHEFQRIMRPLLNRLRKQGEDGK